MERQILMTSGGPKTGHSRGGITCKHNLNPDHCAYCSPQPAKSKLIMVKAPKVKAPKVKTMTRKQFERLCSNCRFDYQADNPDIDLQDVAMDLADCLLYNSEVRAFCQKEWKGISNSILREIIAERICS